MRFLVLLALFVMASSQANACLTPDQTRYAVPIAEQTAFDDIQDLSGGAYLSFIRSFTETAAERPPANEAMIFYRRQVGHGADIRVVWFQDGCAIGKASYPAEFWTAFILHGRSA